MSLRKWAILLGILFLFGSFGVFLSRDYLQAGDRLKELIQNEAHGSIAERLDFTKLETGFGYVSLDDFELAFNNKTDSLAIGELRLGWSIFELLRYRSKPVKGITSITVVDPVFVLGSHPSKNDSIVQYSSFADRRDQIISQFEDTYATILQNFKNVSRIEIANGTVMFRSKTGEFTKIASNISGKLSSADHHSAFLFLSLKLMDSHEENLHIDVDLDLDKRSFIAELDLSDYKLKTGLPLSESEYIAVSGGELNGRIQVIKDANAQGKYNFFANGNYEISDLDYSILYKDKQVAFDNSKIVGRIVENSITIESFKQDIAGGTIDITGTVLNLYDPEYSLDITISSVSLEQLLIESLQITNADSRGKIDGRLMLEGPIANPMLAGYIKSDSIYYKQVPILHCSTKTVFRFPDFLTAHTTAQIKDVDISLNTSTRLTSSDSLSVIGSLKGNFLSLGKISLPANNKYNGIANIELLGPLNNLKGNGEIQFTSENEKGIVNFEGDIALDNNYLNAAFKSTNTSEDSTINISAKFAQDFSDFKVNIQNALPILSHDFDLPAEYFSASLPYVNMDVIGDTSNTYLIATALSSSADTLLSFEGLYTYNAENERSLQSEFTLPLIGGRQLKIFANLSRIDDHILLREISSPGLFSGFGDLIDNDVMTVNSTINIDGDIVELNDLFGIQLIDDGNLVGSIHLTGDYKNPEITGNVALRNGSKGSLDGLNAEFSISSSNWYEYAINDLSLSHRDTLITAGDGWINIKNKQAALSVRGEKVDINHYNKLFLGERELLSGNVSFNLHYAKNEKNSSITGTVSVSEGKLGRFHINNFIAVLNSDVPVDTLISGSERTGNAYMPNGMQVEQISLSTPYGLNINGSGFLAFSDNNESDFDVTLNGDILSIFIETDKKFFTQSGGSGSADIHISGSIKNPYISSGHISVNEGYLQFNKVFKKLENVVFEADLKENSRFIEIERLDALIDGNPVNIRNSEKAFFYHGDQMGELEPFELMDDGLNLGVLALYTGKNGIDINIPGVIENKETGTFKLSGLNESESFYLAGPVEMPHARGTILVSDSRIIFPEPTSEENKNPNIAQRFLKRTNWNIHVIPESNNYYIRYEPVSATPWLANLGGKVYVQAKIDDEKEGLYFRGCVDEDQDVEFRVSGDLQSNRGRVELLDFNFQVEKFEAEFVENQAYPILRGKAKTTKRNSENFNDMPMDVFITLYSIDENGQKVYHGTWVEGEPNFMYELSIDQNIANFSMEGTGKNVSKDMPGASQYVTNEKILELFGYAPGNVSEKVAELAVDRMEEALLNPILMPLNRSIRKASGLDEFSIRLNLAKNFAQQRLETDYYSANNRFFDMFLTPELSLGKYLLSDLYFMYRGQLVRKLGDTQDVMGLNHVIGVEYQMRDQFYLEIEYDYDYYRTLDKGDTRLWLRHQIQLKGIRNNN